MHAGVVACVPSSRADAAQARSLEGGGEASTKNSLPASNRQAQQVNKQANKLTTLAVAVCDEVVRVAAGHHTV